MHATFSSFFFVWFVQRLVPIQGLVFVVSRIHVMHASVAILMLKQEKSNEMHRFGCYSLRAIFVFLLIIERNLQIFFNSVFVVCFLLFSFYFILYFFNFTHLFFTSVESWDWKQTSEPLQVKWNIFIAARVFLFFSACFFFIVQYCNSVSIWYHEYERRETITKKKKNTLTEYSRLASKWKLILLRGLGMDSLVLNDFSYNLSLFNTKPGN